MRAISPARTGCRIVVLIRRELKRVAVAARDDRRTAAPLFVCHRGGKEVVRLVARRLGKGEPARRNKLRQYIELV